MRNYSLQVASNTHKCILSNRIVEAKILLKETLKKVLSVVRELYMKKREITKKLNELRLTGSPQHQLMKRKNIQEMKAVELYNLQVFAI